VPTSGGEGAGATSSGAALAPSTVGRSTPKRWQRHRPPQHPQPTPHFPHWGGKIPSNRGSMGSSLQDVHLCWSGHDHLPCAGHLPLASVEGIRSCRVSTDDCRGQLWGGPYRRPYIPCRRKKRGGCKAPFLLNGVCRSLWVEEERGSTHRREMSSVSKKGTRVPKVLFKLIRENGEGK
jgi:hypothetical protein